MKRLASNEPGIYWFDYERREQGRSGRTYVRQVRGYRATLMRDYLIWQRMFYVTAERDADEALAEAPRWIRKAKREAPPPEPRRVSDLEERRRRLRRMARAS